MYNLRPPTFTAFHDIITFKVKVPFFEKALTPNISYPAINKGTAHPAQEICKTVMFPAQLDYYYCFGKYYYYYYYYCSLLLLNTIII